MDEQLRDKILSILEPIIKENNWFLVDLKVGAGSVQVFIDSDKGFSIENCVRVSRLLSSELNQQMPFSDQYTLEVSSPGMDQPFKVMNQYYKYKGRKVDVLTNDGVKRTGRMTEVDEDKIVIEETKIEKHKEIVTRKTDIPFYNIKATTVVVSF
jgi:ribosome maturation factor RimP